MPWLPTEWTNPTARWIDQGRKKENSVGIFTQAKTFLADFYIDNTEENIKTGATDEQVVGLTKRRFGMQRANGYVVTLTKKFQLNEIFFSHDYFWFIDFLSKYFFLVWWARTPYTNSKCYHWKMFEFLVQNGGLGFCWANGKDGFFEKIKTNFSSSVGVCVCLRLLGGAPPYRHKTSSAPRHQRRTPPPI